MYQTPVGFEFRSLMDNWDQSIIKEMKHQNIKMLIDGQNFLLFFRYKDNIYGTTEQNRVAFSKMRHPDEETSKGWLEEAHFSAFNLSDGLKGKPTQDIFYIDDIQDIEVIDKDEAYDALVLSAESEELQNVSMGSKSILSLLTNMKPAQPEEDDYE